MADPQPGDTSRPAVGVTACGGPRSQLALRGVASELLDASELIASLAIGSVGYLVFAFGKRQGRLPQMVVGIALLGFPYFVDGVLTMVVIALGLLLSLWGGLKLGW
jgi:hypothetical protein